MKVTNNADTGLPGTSCTRKTCCSDKGGCLQPKNLLHFHVSGTNLWWLHTWETDGRWAPASSVVRSASAGNITISCDAKIVFEYILPRLSAFTIPETAMSGRYQHEVWGETFLRTPLMRRHDPGKVNLNVNICGILHPHSITCIADIYGMSCAVTYANRKC